MSISLSAIIIILIVAIVAMASICVLAAYINGSDYDVISDAAMQAYIRDGKQ